MPVTAQKNSLPLIFLAGALTMASLWDFRIHEIRIFDAPAMILVCGYLLTSQGTFTEWHKRRQRYLVLFAIIIVYAVYGYILHAHRSSLAILAFALLGLQLTGQRDYPRVAEIFKWLLVLHVTAFLMQLVVFYSSGKGLDFHTLIGRTSRIISTYPVGRPHIRGAGLFQEPNNYCITIYILTTGYLLSRNFKRAIAYGAIFTMMLSESLWGIAGGLVLVALTELLRSDTLPKIVLQAATRCLIFFVAFNLAIWINKPAEEPIPPIYTRILKITSDTSMRDRYLERPIIVEQNSAAPPPAVTPPSQIPTAVSWTLGEGLTTRYFLDNLPNNGVHFLLKSFGALGLLLAGYGFWRAIHPASRNRKLFVTGALVFSFTTYPLVTYAFLWFWFPLLLRPDETIRDSAS